MGEAAQTRTPDTQLFRDVFNASPIGIAVENLEGQPLFVNPAFCSMLGFSEEELRNKHCVDFSPPEDAEKDWALFQQLKAGSIDHYQLEKRYFRKDGSLVWGRLSISLLNSRPSPLVIAMVEDITDKKRAEEARFRHAAIVESSEDAIASGTLDGIIVSWNTGAQHMYGYTEAEAVGKPITILVPRELRDEENKILETVRAGGHISQFETVRVAKTGKRINVSLTISPIKDSSGRMVGVSGIARDITERKRSEQALLSSEQRYRLLFERNVAGVAIGSMDGRVLDCNDGWARILGYESRGEVLGRHASELYFNPEERQPLLDEVRERQAVFSRELKLKRKDGSPVWVLFNAAALNAEHGAPILQGTMIDISEWKRSEEALSGMTRKLIESQEQERARIGRELHDDINQRLAMLSIEAAQLLETPSEIENRVQEFRKRISEISTDVQGLSHDLHSSKLEYLGVVAGIKSWCKEFGERQRVEIDFSNDVHSALPFEIGLSLFRVLQEALHNATKHSGVKRIELQVREDSGEIHLIIRDSGKGFDVEAALQGKGLGLTSMRERVRLVNGTISIESKPMGGTIIHVRVPLESKHAKARGSLN
jgi:PAS domain S-box-containing protein